MKTIVALATPLINCAIHIIRVSGPETYEILSKVSKKEIKKEAYTIQRNFIIDNGEIIDDVLLNCFVAPRSYTGEDSIEINCHGGVIVSKMIIDLLIKNGCEMANRGEFSQRAMINKKINYQQVEAIDNLVHAKNKMVAKVAINAVVGNDSLKIKKLRDLLFNIIGSIEVNIDYPEYDDVPEMTSKDIIKTLDEIKKQSIVIVEKSKEFMPYINGVKIGIIGMPNVGKSSLLNLLSKEKKAIVSDKKGTTRDVVESNIIFDGLNIKLLDTAGIRDTTDEIENFGIEKSYDVINSSDLLIIMKDNNSSDIDKSLKEIIKDKNYIIVNNKSDIKKDDKYINVSIVNNDIKDLLNEIKNKIKKIDFDNYNDLILQSDRQINLLSKIIFEVDLIIEELNKNITLDLIQSKLENIIFIFNNILGITFEYDKLDELFSKFCLGK